MSHTAKNTPEHKNPRTQWHNDPYWVKRTDLFAHLHKDMTNDWVLDVMDEEGTYQLNHCQDADDHDGYKDIPKIITNLFAHAQNIESEVLAFKYEQKDDLLILTIHLA